MVHTQVSRFYKSLLCAVLALVLLLAMVTTASASCPVSGTVRNPNGGSYVNLRDYPAYFGDILARITLGTKVEIVGREGDWYAVRIGCLSGYMNSWFINTSSKAPAQSASGKAVVRTYNGGRLNLRSYASTWANILGVYACGTPVTVLDYEPTWCKVKVDGKTGYMKTEYLAFTSYVPTCTTVTVCKPAKPAVNCGVYQQATELPTVWEPSIPNLPKWQLSWGDPAPIVPDSCFRPLTTGM